VKRKEKKINQPTNQPTEVDLIRKNVTHIPQRHEFKSSCRCWNWWIIYISINQVNLIGTRMQRELINYYRRLVPVIPEASSLEKMVSQP